jgi:hypothetical protein
MTALMRGDAVLPIPKGAVRRLRESPVLGVEGQQGILILLSDDECLSLPGVVKLPKGNGGKKEKPRNHFCP